MNETKDLGIFSSDGQGRRWGTYLYGQCRYNNDPSAFRYSEIRLDDCLGDEHGNFGWGGHDFTEHAEQGSIRFAYEQGVEPILRAKLEGDFRGSYADRDVNLRQRISNQGGELRYS